MCSGLEFGIFPLGPTAAMLQMAAAGVGGDDPPDPRKAAIPSMMDSWMAVPLSKKSKKKRTGRVEKTRARLARLAQLMDDDSSSSESSSDADANDAKVSFAPAFKLGSLGQSRSERMMRRYSGEQALPLT